VQGWLKSGEIDSWSYPDNIPAGEEWPAVLARRIKQSAGLLLLLSKSANESPHVRKEVALAAKKGRRFWLFRLDHCELHDSLEYWLSDVQFVNERTKDWRKDRAALVNDVRHGLGLAPALPRRRSWLRSLPDWGKGFFGKVWTFARTLSLVVLVASLLAGGVLWYSGVFANRVDTTVICDDPRYDSGGPIIGVRVQGNDGLEPRGKVIFQLDGHPAAPVSLDHGRAAHSIRDLGPGEHTLQVEYVPVRPYRASASVPKSFVVADPARYAVIEISSSHVRAVAVNMERSGQANAWTSRADTKAEREADCDLDLDKSGQHFTQGSITRVIEGTMSMASWLKAERVSGRRIAVTVPSGIIGLSPGDDGVGRLIRQLESELTAKFASLFPGTGKEQWDDEYPPLEEKTAGPHIERLTPDEEARWLLSMVEGARGHGERLVIYVGRDSVGAATAEEGGSETVRVHIPGTRALVQYLKHRAEEDTNARRRLQASLAENDAWKRREDYYKLLREECGPVITADLHRETNTINFQNWHSETCLVGEVLGFMHVVVADPIKDVAKFRTAVIQNGDEISGSMLEPRRHALPFEEQLAATIIVDAMNKEWNLSANGRVVRFVDITTDQWPGYYLQRCLNGKGSAVRGH